jgi:hypothetical protein
MMKRIKSQIEVASADTADTEAADLDHLNKDLHIAEVDLAYTRYFPFLEKYVSLYPSHDQPPKELPQDAKNRHWLARPRGDMWKVIEIAMASGEAGLERVRDRVDGLVTAQRKTAAKAAKAAQGGGTVGGAGGMEARNMDASDSEGGGFFEEGV